MTILENFYYGNIDPHECYIGNNSTFSKLLKKTNKLEEQLTEQLTEEQKSLFHDYCESQANLYETSEKEAFIRGFMPLFEQIFLNMKKYQGYYREICGNCYNNEFSEYVYVNEMGDLIKPGYITQKFSKILEDNGFRHIRFHDLRHSCATILHKSGIGMKDIQMWLGHSNIGTTSDIYTHFDDDSKVDSANVMLSNLML